MAQCLTFQLIKTLAQTGALYNRHSGDSVFRGLHCHRFSLQYQVEKQKGHCRLCHKTRGCIGNIRLYHS